MSYPKIQEFKDLSIFESKEEKKTPKFVPREYPPYGVDVPTWDEYNTIEEKDIKEDINKIIFFHENEEEQFEGKSKRIFYYPYDGPMTNIYSRSYRGTLNGIRSFII